MHLLSCYCTYEPFEIYNIYNNNNMYNYKCLVYFLCKLSIYTFFGHSSFFIIISFPAFLHETLDCFIIRPQENEQYLMMLTNTSPSCSSPFFYIFCFCRVLRNILHQQKHLTARGKIYKTYYILLRVVSCNNDRCTKTRATNISPFLKEKESKVINDMFGN